MKAANSENGNGNLSSRRGIVNPRSAPESNRPFVINKGRSVDAVYIMPEISDWADNPLIAALPPALDVIQAGARLAQEPKYDESLRSLPGYVRHLLIHNAMNNLFIPLDIHLDLHQRLQTAIRVGYADRNPVVIDYPKRLGERLHQFDQYACTVQPYLEPSGTAAPGFNILGISGVGKSRGVLRCVQLLPQTIIHSQFHKQRLTCKQLAWLKLDCPFDGNSKGLCIDFFKTVDAILGTNYRHNYGGRRRIVDEMLSDMASVAANHSLGLFIVDEIQRLSLARSGGADRMLNFFVQLVNTIGVGSFARWRKTS
jgi:AAA domain